MSQHRNPLAERRPGTGGDFSYSPRDPADLTVDGLLRSHGLDDLSRRFELGNTEVRDITRLTTRQRMLILSAGRELLRNGNSSLKMDNPDELMGAIARSTGSFAWAMRNKDSPVVQDYAGWNFLVNAQGFRNVGYDWAVRLDDDLGEWSGFDGTIDTMIGYGAGNDDWMRSVIAEFADQPGHALSLAWYLAERSVVSEAYQRERFSRELAIAKNNTARILLSMSSQYGLPMSDLNRSLKQLSLVDFSAFDHLAGGVAAGDRGSLGDYLPGTLRIEVKFGGSAARPEREKDPLDTAQHEVFHAISAQDDRGRVGLCDSDGNGRDVNEGLTELLALLSLDKIKQRDDGSMVLPRVGYMAQTAAALCLMRDDGESFGVLFNAYFGHIENPARLRMAMKAFYRQYELYMGI